MPSYIKILRSFKDHPMWIMDKFTHGQSWVDLLLLVYQQSTSRMINGHAFKVYKGQLLLSDFDFSKRWGWTKEDTDKWMEQLLHHEMISVERGVLTIINWEKYQGRSKVSYGEDERELISALQKKIRSPALDGNYFQNAYHAKKLLERSKTGKKGVLWLIDLINIDDTYCPKIGSMGDLFNKFNKLVQYHNSTHKKKAKNYVSI